MDGMGGGWYDAEQWGFGPDARAARQTPAVAGETPHGFTVPDPAEGFRYVTQDGSGREVYSPDAESAIVAARTLHADGAPLPIRQYVDGKPAFGTYANIG